MQRPILLFLAIAAVTLAWPLAASAQSTGFPGTSYACDFENTYCDFAEQSKLGDAPPSSLRRSTIVSGGRTGSFAVRLHTEPGDNQVHGSGTWERDDLTKAPDASYCNEGQEEWWAVSVLFPSDYSFPAPGQGADIIDFHHNSSSGLPNFGLEARGESGLRISGYGGAQLNGGQYRVQIADPYGAVNNVARNVWYDFVFHIKWSSNGDGVSEGWLNGKKILSYTGATLYTGIACYLKLANYHDATGQPSSVIFDRVLRGASASAVALGALEGADVAPSTVSPPTPSPTTPPAPTSPAPASSGTASPASATMDSTSYTISAGQSVTFTARILGNSATPSGSVAFASDSGPIAGCTNVALSSGTAQCTTGSLAAGQHAITGSYSGDSVYGSAKAGPITLTVNGAAPTSQVGTPTAPSSPVSTPAASLNVQGLWWGGPGESGWGLNLVQQGSIVFATWFTYDSQGRGQWLVMPNGAATGQNSYSGPLYRTTGPAFTDPNFDPSRISTSNVGVATLTFSDSGNGTFTATLDGVSVSKPIVKETFDPRVPVCAEGQAQGSTANYQDLWWRTGGGESGWGVNLTHQGDIIFMTWFTYDVDGKGMWLVASHLASDGAGNYSGTLYRTTGPAFDTPSWNASQVTASPVGNARLSFSDSSNGVLTYTVNGSSGSKPISREAFATPATVCRPS